jgi:transposase InsO family protein
MFSRQCLGAKRIPDLKTLRRQARAWNHRTNRAGTKINWQFDRRAARRKFHYKKHSFKRSKNLVSGIRGLRPSPVTFKLLYCFFVIDHQRRRIVHFNVTAHPTAEWLCQQLREAFPNDGRYKYAILDRDSKFSSEVLALLKSSAIDPVRTSIRSPWQNGVAERWVGSAGRECFDHVIALNEAHVRRLGREFIASYHEDRTHLGLEKDTPSGRPVEPKPDGAELESSPRVGGLHHRYIWKTAA